MSKTRWQRLLAPLAGASLLTTGLVVTGLPGAAWAGTPGPLVYHATDNGSANRQFTVLRVGSDVEVLDGNSGAVLAEQALADTTAVDVTGVYGPVNNTLTVDLSGGPISVPGGISWDGGVGGYNTLDLSGGPAGVSEVSEPSGPHSGSVTLGATSVHYIDIAPIDDTTPSFNYTFNFFTPGPINIGAGPVVMGFQTLQISSSSVPPTFETTNIANKVNVTINTPAGGDTVVLDDGVASTGLSSLTINGTSGANIFTVDTTIPGVSTTINRASSISETVNILGTSAGGALALTSTGTASDTVNIGNAGSVQGVQGSVTLSSSNASAPDTVVLDDSADTTGQNATIGDTQVSGLAPGSINFTGSQLSSLTILFGSGSDTANVTPSPNFPMNLNGGLPNPPTSPGDTLNMNLTGTTSPVLTSTLSSTGYAGSWSFANRRTVTFSHFETLVPPPPPVGGQAVAPSPPLDLTITVDQITLNWGAPVSGGTSPVSSYDVFRFTQNMAATQIATVAAPTTTYTDNNVTAGVTYSYYVEAVNAFGTSAPSNVVSATATSSGPTPSPTPSSSCSGYSGNAAFICALYEDILGRAPDSAGLSSWLSALSSGVSRSQVAYGVIDSSESGTDFLNYIYENCLGRPVDPGGLSTWISAFEAGASVEQVEAGILSSPEFYSDSGSTNSGFVNGVYECLLARPVDPAGLSTWTTALSNGVSRNKVAYEIATSTEAYTDDVESDYQTLLSRPADPAGLATWVAALRSGVSDLQVFADIAGSQEFYRDATGA